ncbi:MAG TPA: hypothetical protein VKO45_01760 [Methanomicrobiales archaeon]|nr:hypothetical protein [Methanomicrobiales archaeon]
MAEGSFPAFIKGRLHPWMLVPGLAWGGIVAGFLLSPPSLLPGSAGCFLGSLAIAGLALTRTKKDIVSLCTPIFALLIFVFPLETPPGLAMQLLFAATLTGLLIRLERRFPP